MRHLRHTEFIWSLLVEGKKSFMTIKCVSLFPRESCLPMLPCVYLWMKMTLETPCTPLPQQQHVFLSFHGLYRECEKSQVKVQGRFQRHGFYNSCSSQMWVFNFPNVLFKSTGQTVYNFRSISIRTPDLNSCKHNDYDDHEINKQTPSADYATENIIYLFYFAVDHSKPGCDQFYVA